LLKVLIGFFNLCQVPHAAMFAQVGTQAFFVYALAPGLPSVKCGWVFFKQGVPAQAGKHRRFLARKLVAVCTHPAAAGGAVRLFSRVANYGWGFAGWAVHLGIIVSQYGVLQTG
jgi:hypothetical protein